MAWKGPVNCGGIPGKCDGMATCWDAAVIGGMCMPACGLKADRGRG